MAKTVYRGTLDDVTSIGGTILHALYTLVQDIRQIYYSRYVLYYLFICRFKVKYQRSYLGFLWALLHPLMMLVILSIAFGYVLGRHIPNYHLFLFGGILPFTVVQEIADLGGRSLISNQQMLRDKGFCKLVFPMVEAMMAGINFLFSIVGIFLILLFFGATFHIQLLILPAAFVLLLIFAFGFSLITMTLITYFRDFAHFITIFFRALYFVSPVIIHQSMLGEYGFVMKYNPLTYYFRLFRAGIYSGTWPNGTTWTVTATASLVTLFIGYIVYKRHEHDYVFRI